MGDPAEPSLEFKSKEEFRATCHALASRMHYLNRVAMGESGFSWEVAEMLKQLGRVFESDYASPETQAAFGNGYSAGTLTKAERRAHLIKRLTDDA
ncbi:hypothetical protein N4R57_14385 [Rhodobacteraceae bacterium D3-12]|nr:hypothetical protein N4R57_14385 [Rhodobacteraceae bacterium D3-12]